MKHKALSITPLVTISLAGIGINTLYYNYYFIEAGYPVRLSMIMAISFLVFESFLWLYKKVNRGIGILKISLVIFSVLVTLSSQFSSTSQKEQEAREDVYELSGENDNVQRYEAEIARINAELDRIGRMRENDLIISKTAEELKYYRAEKTRYETLLFEAQAVNREQVEEIVKVESIYDWFAYDLPLIFNQGITGELIRVLFQLFSSVVLALMAPVSLSQVQKIFSEGKSIIIDPEPVIVEPVESVPEPVTIDPVKPDPTEPEVQEPKKINPFEGLSSIGLSNIIMSLTPDGYEKTRLTSPSDAHAQYEAWLTENGKTDSIRYPEDAYGRVHDWILSNGYFGRSQKEIIAEAEIERIKD